MHANLFAGMLAPLLQSDRKTLSRVISLVENELPGSLDFLKSLPASNTPVIGITGPPGAGKSTLVNALIGEWVAAGKKIGILCVDPSSPFNLGALLGDRIRMNEWYNNPSVYIRSLASRGSLGGLHPQIIEITELMKVAGFDMVLVETVGVGQSEIEIAGLADTTIVVLVPEAGDEVQTMKAGLMEIADLFVVNKADRPGADILVKNLRLMLMPTTAHETQQIPILKTNACKGLGVKELVEAIHRTGYLPGNKDRKTWLLAERAFQLIQKKRMADLSKARIKSLLEKQMDSPDFNLFRFIDGF